MTTLVHLHDGTSNRWAVRRHADGTGTGAENGAEQDVVLDVSLADLLAMPLSEARALIEATTDSVPAAATAEVLAPVDQQEVWAAGVTYRRSRDGRAEESSHASMYDLVYDAERPEIFFKATPQRVVAHGSAVGIRADSSWDVPEPEVGLVINSWGEIFGYVAGNDMSSRSIEGENPLYLPQAKMYTRSCALGPAITPAWEVPAGPLDLAVRIERAGTVVYEDRTTTDTMKRSFAELIDWLTKAMKFPVGVVLLTGTGLVPGSEFTLAAGDIVTVSIDSVGTLTNPVVVVGR